MVDFRDQTIFQNWFWSLKESYSIPRHSTSDATGLWFKSQPAQFWFIFIYLFLLGGESPFQHFLLYLCWLLFFRAETSWPFSYKPCARFKTIFIKIGPRVMTQRCLIARWVQRKTDFPLKLHTNRVFCLFCLSGYTSSMFYLIYLVYLE